MNKIKSFNKYLFLNMENQDKKCSLKEHKEIKAICFCYECNIYMCNKCENLHSKLFENHHSFKIDANIKDIFTGFCKEEKHNDKLEYFCKDHNKLCCGLCLCKIKGKGKGQHKDCDVCYIEDIKELKKDKLKENIEILSDLSSKFEESINQIKIIINKINENREELKLKIQKIFTKIRNTLNEREDELLLQVDKKFEDIYFKEDIIKESENFPNIVKKSLDKGKSLIDNEWNDESNMISFINDCINIENNIKTINKINESLKECNKSNNFKIQFYPKEESEISKFLKQIITFGNIYTKQIPFSDSFIIENNNEYIYSIINWINSDKEFKSELLYRKTRDGDSYDTFHNLCDNQGNTLILIKSNEGFIIGGYTPLNWDKDGKWKKDDNTFLFSLTKNKVFKKKEQSKISIYCGKNTGPFFAFIGFNEKGKANMSQGRFAYKFNETELIFQDFNEIIPNERKSKFFDVEEVEIYKIMSE